MKNITVRISEMGKTTRESGVNTKPLTHTPKNCSLEKAFIITESKIDYFRCKQQSQQGDKNIHTTKATCGIWDFPSHHQNVFIKRYYPIVGKPSLQNSGWYNKFSRKTFFIVNFDLLQLLL